MRTGRKPMRLPVHGQWMTLKQVAEAVGASYEAVRIYRSRHRDRDGRPMSLEAIYDRYQAMAAGTVPRHPGMPPRKRLVNGRRMTRAEVADALGVTLVTLDSYMYNHRCGLAEACRGIETRSRRRAERKILGILKGD